MGNIIQFNCHSLMKFDSGHFGDFEQEWSIGNMRKKKLSENWELNLTSGGSHGWRIHFFSNETCSFKMAPLCGRQTIFKLPQTCSFWMVSWMAPITYYFPSGHQTWRAGKWTMEICDFPSQISIQFGDFPASHAWWHRRVYPMIP